MRVSIGSSFISEFCYLQLRMFRCRKIIGSEEYWNRARNTQEKENEQKREREIDENEKEFNNNNKKLHETWKSVSLHVNVLPNSCV